jgi:hypothetical protein
MRRRRHAVSLLLSGATVLCAKLTFADVISPPTLVLDFLFIGDVAGLLAGLLLVGLTVAIAWRLRRSGKGWWKTLGLCSLFFVLGNFACYLLANTILRKPRGAPIPTVPRANPAERGGPVIDSPLKS